MNDQKIEIKPVSFTLKHAESGYERTSEMWCRVTTYPDGRQIIEAWEDKHGNPFPGGAVPR